MHNIKKNYEKELTEFEKNFNQAVSSHVDLLDIIMKYLVKVKGKRIRPLFVILSSGLFDNINLQTYRAASLIELLHTATLVHDDVVDDSLQRRGLFSINALWKNKIAVLVGDYLLSKGLLLALTNKDFRTLEILSSAVKDMSEGELLQAEKARKLDITEAVYFDIITRKTASLIAAACNAGAYCATQNDEIARTMNTFGIQVGIAFQIKDDLLDYSKTSIGKPTANDIKEKKMTLPLIYTLQHCDLATKKYIKSIFKNPIQKKKEVQFIIEQVNKIGGTQYAEQKMEMHKQNAIQILQTFPDNIAKKSLIELVNYTVNRTH